MIIVRIAMITKKSRGRMNLAEKRAILFFWSDELLELNCDYAGKILVFYREKSLNKCGKKFPFLPSSSCYEYPLSYLSPVRELIFMT